MVRFYLFFTYCFFLNHTYSQITYQDAFPNLSFEFPTEIQPANDGSDRLFVLEQRGRIKVFQNHEDTTLADTFLDITDRVSFSNGQEIGLLGLAFHPNYSDNGYFYVYHTQQSSVSGVNVEIVLARYTVNTDNPDQADPNSRLEIFSFDKNQSSSNHNGGKIAFGPEGYLYISIGDGGGGGDPNKNAQNLDNVFGSILRIDVDLDGNNPIETNPDLPNGNYEIPSDNPRVGLSGLDELYAWGIRNTWKFSFDKDTDVLWGADVGQGDREEINIITKGGNYGWNRFEGNTVEDSSTTLITSPDIKPIFEYGRNNGDISITGGYVYHGPSNNPQLQGKYIYGDYISGRVWALDYNSTTGDATSELLFRTNGQNVSSFGLDRWGALYFSDYGTTAKIYKITGGNEEPQNVVVEGMGNWLPIADGTNGNVDALAAGSDGKIYIGGEFSEAGSIVANNLAIYDPVSGWSDFGSGTNGKVAAMAIGSNGALYVGGDFTQINGISANNIAVWDGTDWSALGQGTNGPVAAINLASNGGVYIGGTFETAGGLPTNNIALWHNNSWTSLTDNETGISGTNNEVRAISLDENDLVYVGGNFDSAGGNNAPRIAVWNGTNWGTLGAGTSGFVQTIHITPENVYAGGNFAIAGNITANRIARWDRAALQWEALGMGLGGNVNALQHDGTYLYVGGNFETASDGNNVNKVVKNMARWSQATGWEALGPGTDVGANNQINALLPYNDTSGYYVGGNFTATGETDARSISVWMPEEPLNIPGDNYIISAVGTSCRSSANGSISINSKNSSLASVAALNGNGLDNDYPFSENLEINDLEPGSYQVCITANGVPGYQNCAQITITQPEELIVTSTLNPINNILTLKMSGGEQYTIVHNDRSISTDQNEYQLVMTDTINTVQVATDKECQGTYEKVFSANGSFLYPNPFRDHISLNSPDNTIKTVEISIYSSLGVLMSAKIYEYQNGIVNMDTAPLSSGMYYLIANNGNSIDSFKIIKE